MNLPDQSLPADTAWKKTTAKTPTTVEHGLDARDWPQDAGSHEDDVEKAGASLGKIRSGYARPSAILVPLVRRDALLVRD